MEGKVNERERENNKPPSTWSGGNLVTKKKRKNVKDYVPTINLSKMNVVSLALPNAKGGATKGRSKLTSE